LISETSELQQRLELELKAIGRPMFDSPILPALKSGVYAAHAEAVRKWEAENLDKAKAWASIEGQLVNEENRLAMLPFETARATERARKLGEMVGSRLVEAMKTPRQTQALDAAKAWDASTSWCLALLGGVGNGKSFAAAWLAAQAMALRASVVWLRATEGSTSSLYGEDAQRGAREARMASLLVIDDLGAEMATASWQCWLEDILGARYANSARTVLTSNLDAVAFRARIGVRLSDRIREGTVCGTDETSMRKRGAA